MGHQQSGLCASCLRSRVVVQRRAPVVGARHLVDCPPLVGSLNDRPCPCPWMVLPAPISVQWNDQVVTKRARVPFCNNLVVPLDCM